MPLRKRIGRTRRGISAIVSSLLLVVAVGIIGAFVVTWANSSFAIQQGSIANQTVSRINLVKEDFVIEDVWFYTDGQEYMNVTVRNNGDLAIKVSHIYINNSQVWNTGESILIGQKEQIKVQKDWSPGAPQTILVKTERGTEIKQVWKS